MNHKSTVNIKDQGVVETIDRGLCPKENEDGCIGRKSFLRYARCDIKGLSETHFYIYPC